MTDTELVTLLKKHLRIEEFNDDDAYLAHLLSAGKGAILDRINRKESEILVSGEWPKSMLHALLMLCGSWYMQRESISEKQMHEVPDSVSAILKPFTQL